MSQFEKELDKTGSFYDALKNIGVTTKMRSDSGKIYQLYSCKSRKQANDIAAYLTKITPNNLVEISNCMVLSSKK